MVSVDEAAVAADDGASHGGHDNTAPGEWTASWIAEGLIQHDLVQAVPQHGPRRDELVARVQADMDEAAARANHLLGLGTAASISDQGDQARTSFMVAHVRTGISFSSQLRCALANSAEQPEDRMPRTDGSLVGDLASRLVLATATDAEGERLMGAKLQQTATTTFFTHLRFV